MEQEGCHQICDKNQGREDLESYVFASIDSGKVSRNELKVVVFAFELVFCLFCYVLFGCFFISFFISF